MSSSRAAEGSTSRTRFFSPRTWSLRVRLLVTQIVLLAVVCAAIGIGTEFALHRFLTQRLDDSLLEAGSRSTVIYDVPLMPFPLPRPASSNDWPGPGLPPGLVPMPDAGGTPGMVRFDPELGPGPSFLNAPGQAARTLGAVIGTDGSVDAGFITAGGQRSRVSDAAAAQLAQVRPNKRPETLDLDGLGRYRVIGLQSRRSGQTIVVGLPTAANEETQLWVLGMFCIVAIAALLAATIAGVLIIRRQLAPLSRVSAAAREVADLELDRGEVSLPARIVRVDPAGAHTEVGQLGSALNRMLDRVAGALSARHASETRVRQFVADASHELRTPLAAIRGYTELAQRNRDKLPDDVAHAMSRVESETHRMTQLVEDMLLLARLDAGRGLVRESVDLSRMVVDTVSDAHVAGPDHAWLLDLPADPVVIVGDEARLHQVLANLLANARIHTPAGTTVTTSLAIDGSAAVLTVADDGPGIPAALKPEVFERFARGDSSRSRPGAAPAATSGERAAPAATSGERAAPAATSGERAAPATSGERAAPAAASGDSGGTGLGLSIVSAVVKAHDGTIEVHSAPGSTLFVVTFPDGSQPPHSGDQPEA